MSFLVIFNDANQLSETHSEDYGDLATKLTGTVIAGIALAFIFPLV